ncbi:MAG: hypothetical protein PVG35_09020 [Desulfobacterales bacterium]|jgi:hypothetical protein
MSEEPVEFNGEEENESDDNKWENRILCRDESCIGVIGPDGRCKECGRPYEKEQTEDKAHTAESYENQAADAAVADVPPTSDNGDDWENRTLCSDESCIGVIGPDGRCKECGKPYAG